MTKKRKGRYVWLAFAITALLMTVANNINGLKLIPAIQAQDGERKNTDIEAAKIKSVILTRVVISRGGTLYRKELTLINTDSKFNLIYSCVGRRCDCRKAEQEVEQGIAKEFLRDVGTLKIEERRLDHMWTEMKINYLDGSSKTLARIAGLGAAGEKIFSFHKPCASVERELKASIANRKVPAGLVITYDDMHPLLGGTIIVIRGDGGVERRVRLRKESKARVIQNNITQLQILELIQQLIRLKAWEQHTPNRRPVPDESRATLTINVDGQTSESWEWFNDISKNNRLVQVREKMLALNKKRLIKDRPQVGR